MWAPGQTRLAAEDVAKLRRAVRGTAGMRLVLAVYSWPGTGRIPADRAGREQFCTYTANALRRFPRIRDVVIWNEPNKALFWYPQRTGDPARAAPVLYAKLLARCWDVLHAARWNVNVIGLALSSTGNDNAGSHSPGNFIRLVGDAYRASGRKRPLFDTVGHHPYGLDGRERPWRRHVGTKTIALGDWNKLMLNLHGAFAGTSQPIPGEGAMSIWYLEYGVQTRVHPARRKAYRARELTRVIPDEAGGDSQGEPPAETSPAPDQATQVGDAIRLAACQPYVGAIFNFLLFDEPTLAGWQSGAYYADRRPKRSLEAFRAAIAEAHAGRVDCDALKGGRPSDDYVPPLPPTGLTVTAAEGAGGPGVALSWAPSADPSGVASYAIYRNGVYAGSTTATTWSDTARKRSCTYAVRAVDAAGNLSGPSQSVTVRRSARV
jgi:hypothetical protein